MDGDKWDDDVSEEQVVSSGLAVQGFLVRPSFDSGLSILDYCLPLPLHLPSPAC